MGLFFRSGWWRAHAVAATVILVSTVIDLGGAIFNDRAAAVAAEAGLVLAWSMVVIAPLVGTITRTGTADARISLPIITSAVGSLALYAGSPRRNSSRRWRPRSSRAIGALIRNTDDRDASSVYLTGSLLGAPA